MMKIICKKREKNAPVNTNKTKEQRKNKGGKLLALNHVFCT